MKAIVSIIMGSTSDWPVMKKAADFFETMEIPFEVNALSAHRTPEEVDPSLPSHSAIDKQGIQVGVIAQEIQEVLPDLVRVTSLGCYSVNPDNLTWYLVNAIKELTARVKELESRQ